MTYPVPAKQVETLYEIKKSKFIACAGFANSRESAMALLDSVKQRYPDARLTASLAALPVNPY